MTSALALTIPMCSVGIAFATASVPARGLPAAIVDRSGCFQSDMRWPTTRHDVVSGRGRNGTISRIGLWKILLGAKAATEHR